MPAVYDEHGIRFAFPENWSLDAPGESAGEMTVTVTSPGTAFWSLSVYPGDVRPAELLAEALAAMQAEYPALEFDDAEEEIEEQLLVGYDLNFFYLDLCNTATVRGFFRGGSTFLLLCQAEDHELAEAEPVFRAITASLLRDDRDGQL